MPHHLQLYQFILGGSEAYSFLSYYFQYVSLSSDKLNSQLSLSKDMKKLPQFTIKDQ